MTNKILTLPKYLLPYDNGYTNMTENVWMRYNGMIQYKDSDFKLFYRVIPYLIISHKNRYLVFESGGSYCFNINGLAYIKEGLLYDPILTVVKSNATKSVKSNTNIHHAGYIKTLKHHPNDISVVYSMSTNKENNTCGMWLNLDELINKCRKFDSFGIEYIDYLVNKKFTRR